MSSPVITIAEGMKEKKRIKTKIRVGSVVKAKVGEMEEITGGGKKHEDEERSGGTFPRCGGEEEVLIQIRIWVKEIYKLFFTCGFKFKNRG